MTKSFFVCEYVRCIGRFAPVAAYANRGQAEYHVAAMPDRRLEIWELTPGEARTRFVALDQQFSKVMDIWLNFANRETAK